MTLLSTTVLGNPVWAWLLAVAVGVGVFFLLRFLRGFGLRRLAPLAERAKPELWKYVLATLKHTRIFFLVLVALYAGSWALTLPAAASRAIGTVALLGFLVQIGFWAHGLLTFWLTSYTKRKLPEDVAAATTVSALGFLGKLVLWSIIVLLALQNLGINITTLVAGLGIGGIAIALAIQNVLGDLFASLSIVFDKPFVVGDFIIVDDFLGTVERVGLKTSRIRSLSGEQLVFSNNDLLRSRIRNYKRMYERRIVFSFGVIYQTPYKKLVRIPGMVREIIESQEQTRFDRAHFQRYGDFSLNFEVVYYVLSPDYNLYMDIQQAINLALYQRFEEEGISFAYPTQMLYVNAEPVPNT